MAKFTFSFKPSKQGMRKVLGDLESDLMELVWARGAITVREAHALLAHDREIAYTTVMTVMSRLADKGLLRKRKEGAAYRYEAALSKEEFGRTACREIVDALLVDFGTPFLSQLVETMGKEDPDKMDELAKLIEKKRREKRG